MIVINCLRAAEPPDTRCGSPPNPGRVNGTGNDTDDETVYR
jgi:hypothetical protein